ncbi:MAG: hypothetical protein Q9222_001274 [Ikaeria aurantiellina]
MNDVQEDSSIHDSPKIADETLESSESSSPKVLYAPERQSSSVSNASGGVERQKKRKRSASRNSNGRTRRLKRSYNAQYLDLLNDTITEIISGSASSKDSKLCSSQVGITRWNRHEKEHLFWAVGRYGRDSLQPIAVQIGSKSEPEIRVYLQTLAEASAKQHVYGDESTLTGLTDIPSAVEISQQGCDVLEQAADSLAKLQQKHEEQAEKLKHADFWNLNHETADWVEQSLNGDEAGKAEVLRKLPAAEILHLKNFLRLSDEIFMNSGDPDGNWRTFRTKYERPSMLFTAFADLGELATSITKRLAQSSLFFAMSRLRASESGSYNHQRVVRQGDVLTALNVVGMKPNARDGWANVARRCKLNVYRDSKAITSGHPMSYSSVERSLMPDDLAADEQPSPSSTATTNSSDSELDDGSEHSAFSQTSSLISSDYSDVESITSSDRSQLESTSDKQTDAYLEYIDHEASRKEELRLWKMLGKDPPQELRHENPRMVADPGPYRHDRADLEDWRQWVAFKPEWEAYDMEDLDSDLVENRKRSRFKADMDANSGKQGRVKEHSHSQGRTGSNAGIQPGSTPLQDMPSGSDSQYGEEYPESEIESSSDGSSSDEMATQRDPDHASSADDMPSPHRVSIDPDSISDQEDDRLGTDAGSPVLSEILPSSVSISASDDEGGNHMSDVDAGGQHGSLDEDMDSGSDLDDDGERESD